MQDFDTNWERCKPYLADTLEGLWTLEAVEQEIREGRAVLWPMERSACVTQIHAHPKGRVLRLWLAGGDLQELLHFLPVADMYAAEQGCMAIEIEGRAGWEKVLTGYSKRRVILIKEIG